jgi:hypothetical protein
VAGFIAINARGYLLTWWGLSIPPTIYGMGTLVFIWILAFRPVKNLIDMLRVDATARQAQIPAIDRQITGKDYVGQVHKFPLRLGYLMLIFDVILFCLPYLSGVPDRPIAPATYALCFCAACMLAIMVIYIFRYRVTLKSDRIVIRALSTCEVPFADIANIRVVTTKNVPPVGPRGVVSMTDGRTIRFNGMLTGFNDLIDALTVKTSKTVG